MFMINKMGELSDKELDNLICNFRHAYKYSEELDRESAYELLNSKIEKINFAEVKGNYRRD